MIGGGALGSDLPGVSWAWPNATFAERRVLARTFTEYVWGMIWFLQTDPAVPPAVQADMADYGLCADEFLDTDPPHWPHQLYVREARRLVGDFVLTQNMPTPAFVNRSIGLGSYAYDAHTIQRGLQNGTSNHQWAVNEGEIQSQPPAYIPAYRVPYDALLPSRTQLTNVLAAVAVSASHVVFTSLRMEPTWMILGHAAGAAAAEAARSGLAVQDVDVPALQAALVAAGQIIVP